MLTKLRRAFKNWRRRVYEFGHQLRSHARQWVVISIAVVSLVAFLWSAWLQGRGPDFRFGFRALRPSSMRTVVTLDALDPDTSTVVAHVSTILSESDLFWLDPSIIEQIPELKGRGLEVPPRSEYRVYYQQPEIRDLSSSFSLLGLRMIFQMVGHPQFDRVQGSLQSEPPHDSTAVLSVVGDPRLFPFDRYVIVYEVHGGAFLEYNKKIARIDSTSVVLPHFPGMIVRELSKQELEGWDGSIGKEFDNNLTATKQPYSNLRKYHPEFWTESGVALSVERPLFLRVLTIVLGVTAVLSMVLVYSFSDPSRYFLNSLGAFAALWGVRSILTASAPKTPNVVDFVVLALFIGQSVIVAIRWLMKSEKTSETTTD
jgi:hypothetical protein